MANPLQPLVDWCTQPMPAFLGDAHVVPFWFHTPPSERAFVYYGDLAYRPPTGINSHFEGTGRLIPTVGNLEDIIKSVPPKIPPEWVRLTFSLFRDRANAGVEFMETEEGKGIPRPGAVARSIEADVVDVSASEERVRCTLLDGSDRYSCFLGFGTVSGS